MKWSASLQHSYYPRSRKGRRVPSRIVHEYPDSDTSSEPHGVSANHPAVSRLPPSQQPFNIMDEPVPNLFTPPPVSTSSVSSAFVSEPETSSPLTNMDHVLALSSSSSITNPAYATAQASLRNQSVISALSVSNMPEPNKVLSLNELERFLEADVAWEVEDVESFRDSPKYQLELLMKLSLSKTEMKKRGFIVDPLQPGDIQAKKRCDVCHKQIGNFKRLKFDDGGMPIVTSNGFLKEPSMACKYHDGVVQNKKWTCCKKSAYEGTKPCKGAQEHKPHIYAKDELETLWKFVPTPSTHSKSAEHHAAVAVDCEMGISELGDSELIRVTLVDYFTSEVLIDELVYPDVQMKHLNTRFSGVTWAQLDQARRRGDCLVGRQAARECVFNFVGPSTVIIGHSVENDLKALRWIHHRVVDTFTLERRIWDEEQNNMIASQAMIEIHSTEKSSPKNMPPKEPKTPKLKGSGSLSLKTVTSIRLGRNIQQRGGHDSKEDAIAARDIARWHVLNSNHQ